MSLWVDLLVHNLIEGDHCISYCPWRSCQTCNGRSQQKHIQWASRSMRRSTAVICVGRYIIEADVCGCFPFDFFDCGWPTDCPMLGAGTLRSKYMFAAASLSAVRCKTEGSQKREWDSEGTGLGNDLLLTSITPAHINDEPQN